MNDICGSSWDQTTCQVPIDIRCLWMLSPWILYWGSEHREFDVAIKRLAEFLKYLCGFTTQVEEDWFDGQCSRYYIDLTGRRSDSRYIGCSKALSGVLRHNRRVYLFSERRSMNIADLFEPDARPEAKTSQHVWSAVCSTFAMQPQAEIFSFDIHTQWEWYPYSAAATYPSMLD